MDDNLPSLNNQIQEIKDKLFDLKEKIDTMPSGVTKATFRQIINLMSFLVKYSVKRSKICP